MNAKELTSRSHRIEKIKSLRDQELNQWRQELESTQHKKLVLKRKSAEVNSRLSRTLDTINQRVDGAIIHCEQIQAAWQFVDALRSDMAKLHMETKQLYCEEEKIIRSMATIKRQLQHLSDVTDQLSCDISIAVQEQESSAIEDLIASTWSRPA